MHSDNITTVDDSRCQGNRELMGTGKKPKRLFSG